MASAFYTQYRETMLGGGTRVVLTSGTIKVRAVNTGTDYTFSAAHTALASITAYSGTTDPTISANKAITGGVFDADDITSAWTSVDIDGAKTIDALVIYEDAATDVMCAYLELGTSFTPNGGDINLNWNGSGIWAVGA